MTTLAAAQASPVKAHGSRDRVFYSGISIAMALTVVAGFAPTYYLRGYVGSAVSVSGGTSLTPLMALHGAIFTGWIALFIVQTMLIAARRTTLHRRLGYASIVLATAMIVVGMKTAIAAAARGAAPPGIDPLAFLAVPFFDIVLFAGFYTAAVVRRRDKETHKRLMILAYVSIITAGIARLPGLLSLGPPAFFALSFLFVVAGMVYDRASRGRIHPVYAWGLMVLVLSVALRLAISGTAAWRSFAELLIG